VIETLQSNLAHQMPQVQGESISFVRHRMLISRHSCASLILLTRAITAFAHADVFPSPEAATAALLPNKKFDQWVSTEGDLNGDGIKDLAMILTHNPEDEPLEIRLVVLVGVSTGGYLPLSISSKYCVAQKFYNLKAEGPSLFVYEVHKADGDGEVTNTLQFRFNKKLADLELIGRENIYESFQNKSYGRTSVNYPAGTTIVYERIHGRIKATERSRFVAPPLARLNGFDCDKYFDGKPF
jgi:hypothetical protein